ncbi:hypothetical protein Droror1_Dr00003653 [Drosera rotundifolia]
MSKILDPSKSRQVLEPLTSFDLTQLHPSSSITALAITTIPDSQTLIHLGTDSGSLVLLSLKTSSIEFIRQVRVSGNGVREVSVVGGIGVVVAVCDGGGLYLGDLMLIGVVEKLGFLKGVSAVAKQAGKSGKLADLGGENGGGMRKRILRRLGGGSRGGGVGRLNGVEGREVEVDGEESECVFAVACGKKLILIEVGRSEIGDGSCRVLKEILCIESVATLVWIDDSIIAGSDTGYSVVSCITGESRLIFLLPDGSSDPYVKLLVKSHKVLLLVDNVGVVVDADGQPVSGSLVFSCVPDSVGELSLYVVAAGDGKMELYHRKSGAFVQGLSIGGSGVGRCVIADDVHGRFVAVATPSKVTCFREISHEEQIKDLLRKKNFMEAVSLAEDLEREGYMSKEMTSFVYAQVGFLLLFDLQFEKAVDHFLLSDTMQPSEIFPFIMRDPNRWSLLVPRNRYWGLHPPPSHIEDVVEDGLLAIQRAIFLRKAGVETPIDDKFLLNTPSRSDLLQLAFKNIIRYLQASRDKDLSLPVREGVETLLMYLYRSLNYIDDMEKLASSENSCIVDELEALLEESGHLRVLAFLYAHKGMSSKALAIWRALARNYSSGLWKESTHENGIRDLSTAVLPGRRTAAVEASKILDALSDQDLILQHLGWISEVDQDLAVQVLTSEKRVYQLIPDDVVAAIDPRKVELLQRYLQWLIEDQGSNDSQLHTLYALSLAKSAIETLEPERATERLNNGALVEKYHGYEPGMSFEGPIRERLQIFLHSSDLYEPEEVLDLIEGSELWMEKAILFRKLGQETLVLQILALKLEDSEAAEQYCAELGRPDAYMQLLDMYLDPQNGKEPMFKSAVRLLHNHGESLDPLQVLERLSPNMPLQLASETILRMLRARLHHHRQGQIVHNISRAVDVDVRLARLEERARHVQISDESLCDSCHARLGTKLFAMYPDDSIVCYKCFRRQGESTSFTGRDFKVDIMFKPGWLVSR